MEAMTSKKSDREALARLADAFVEDILNASDEDILAEAREDYPDPDPAAARARALFDKAAGAAGKNRLAAARAQLAAQGVPATVTRLDPAEARRRLQRALTRDPAIARRLTRAARNDQGAGLSDNEVQGLLEDLEELGISIERDEP